MKGHKDVIAQLNKILGNELIAINQYFFHSRIIKDDGYEALSKHFFEESIDEMKHADVLTQRILFLEGHPNLQELGRLNIGETFPEMLSADLDLEMRAIADLREAIGVCEANHDFVTRMIFSDILKEEEEHVDWLEAQIVQVKDMGLQNYLQSGV